MASSNTTMEAQEILREGWLTVFKSRNPTFLTKQKPDKVLERAWGVLHAKSPKGPLLSFFQDNHKQTRVLRRDKVELFNIRGITKLFGHPKHANCFTIKIKGKRNRLLFNCDQSSEVNDWITTIAEIAQLEFKIEKVIWEYLDDSGLWQALADKMSYELETHYCEQENVFIIGNTESTRCHYHLGQMHRLPSNSKHTQRLRRTPFIYERPEALYHKMKDLPAIWEWGDPSTDDWHPFERDTNIQIEDMYDSGSQWAELTLCIPSPTLLLLNLQDMKLVNSRTQVRHSLKRVDNTPNMIQACPPDPFHRSPSPEFDNEPHIISPVSPLFQPLQSFLEHLQVPRKNVSLKQLLGEGAFGEVYLAHVVGLRGNEGVSEVAVKQLRLSDFIARHGHHSQQMEDFLREAKEMAKVDHHRIVQLIAVCTLDFPLLLIEEYMNQGDLLAVLKESRPSMPLVLQLSFAWQVADGMDYLASELQCVHRDLAARNVMVHKTEDGDMLAKIADFGLSRHLYSEMYKHSGAKPRPLPAKWMALESLMYFIFTTKSDVWSFGVLLWEVMTLGRTPYPGVENRELLEQIEEHGLKLSKPKGCPQLIYDIILDCTYHEPDERPTFGNLRDKLVILYEDAKSGKLQKTQDGSDEDLSKVKPEPTPNTADETSPTATDDTPPTETPPTQTTPIEPTTLEETPNEISTETPVTKPDENIQEIPSDLNKELEIPSQKKSPDLIPTINLEEIEVGVAEGDDVVGVTDKPDDVMGVVKSDKSDDVMGVVKSRMSVKEFSEIGHIYYVIDEDKMGVAPIPPASHIMPETDTPTANGDVPLA